MATLLPYPELTFFSNAGVPLAGGKVYTYVPGTTTPKQTWQDANASILNTNPITLDSAGRAIIYGTGSYRFIVQDAAGNTIYDQVTTDTSTPAISTAGTSGGTANAQTVTAANFTSTDGQIIIFKAGATNTGAMSLNPNGSGPINVLKDTWAGPKSLIGGEVVAGNDIAVVYDSSAGAFHLISHPVTNNAVTLASATTTDLGTVTTRNVVISGTTTITSFGSSASTSAPIYNLKFTGALTLTYNATSLILPTAANITTAANDTAVAMYLGSGNWQVISYQRASGAQLASFSGHVVQMVNTTTGALATGTTTIPFDDTIPQNTEGDQYMSLSITPKAAANLLKIDVVWNGTNSAASRFTVALFQDSTANALAAAVDQIDSAGNSRQVVFTYWMAAGTTSSTTFKVRAGANNPGTTTFNGQGGTRLYGGVMASSITITEIQA